MKGFTYYTPTEVVFGRNAEEQVAPLLKKYGGHKVLVVFGGGSVRRSGLLDRVCGQLAQEGIDYLLFGGVVPNPRLSMAREGIDLCRKEGIDFLLAVGGGSVIDMCKAIAYGVPYAGDVWDFFYGKAKPQAALPVGCVLTFPASGSEMSDSCVITNEADLDKRGVSSPFGRARFATLNPELSYTLPPYQTAAGVTDIMMHTMERYFIPDTRCDLTDEIAEGLLRTVIKNGAVAVKNPADYNAMAEVFWASSLSHNNLTECGRGKDFSVHKLGHALSARYGVTHGASLSAVWGAWANELYLECVPRFAQFARRVWNVSAEDDKSAAREGIDCTVSFFQSIGMPVSLAELNVGIRETDLRDLSLDATMNDTLRLSRIRPLDATAVEAIYKRALT